MQLVNGVGKKKAERIAVDLADKLEDMAVATATVESGSPLVDSGISALVGLGYTRAEADAAIRRVLKKRNGAEMDVESLVRESLAEL